MAEANKQPSLYADLITFVNSQGIEARGTLLKLTNSTVVFEVYNPYSIVQLSEVLGNLNISRGNQTIYKGRAVVSNLVNTGLMLIVSATLVDPWIDISNLKPGPSLRKEVNNFLHSWIENHQSLNPEYQLSVSKIRNFLQEFNLWLDQGEMIAGITNSSHATKEILDEFTTSVNDVSSELVDELFLEFNKVAETIPDDEQTLHKAYARHELHPLIMCSPFMHRTYTKPLGYAGDYEMVNMILRNEPQGATTYAKVVDSILLRSGTAEAHRNRIDILYSYIEKESKQLMNQDRPLKILNIGCGPAVEVQRFIKNSPLSDNLDIVLVDFNQETLEYAKNKINTLIKEKNRKTRVTFFQDSIHSMLKTSGKNQGTPIGDQFDMVCCAGLFDYLSDKICKRLVKLFYTQTKPGGLTILTNVSKEHSVRGVLEHLQEWYLILRNENELRLFVPDGSEHQVIADMTGINIFLEIRKPKDAG